MNYMLIAKRQQLHICISTIYLQISHSCLTFRGRLAAEERALTVLLTIREAKKGLAAVLETPKPLRNHRITEQLKLSGTSGDCLV